MKMLIITLLTFCLNAYADFGSINKSVALDNTGSILGAEKIYINVVNSSGGALLNGDVVVLDASADNGYSVTTSTTAGAVPHCILDQACANGALCRCQTFGYKSDVNFDRTNAPATAGFLAFISEDTAGKIEAEAKASIAASDVPVGVFYDSETASGDVELFIRLR